MAQASKLFDLSAAASVGVASAKPVDATANADSLATPGPRKLVRPQLPEHLQALNTAPRRLRGPAPLARHERDTPQAKGRTAAASHAEALYFQKQIQTQTPMVFVLEDGEQLEGVIEWFDRDCIKIRNRTRVLVFKRTIKYLYKAGDTQG